MPFIHILHAKVDGLCVKFEQLVPSYLSHSVALQITIIIIVIISVCILYVIHVALC